MDDRLTNPERGVVGFAHSVGASGDRAPFEDDDVRNVGWCQWVTQGRYSSDSSQRSVVQESNLGAARRMIAAAEIASGDSVLDVGSGEGLLGLLAMDELGNSGSLTFSDVSNELLGVCRVEAEARAPRSLELSYVQTPAESLIAIPAASQDVVLLRSVLLFCTSFDDVFSSLYRVLHPGGRAVLHEWIDSIIPPRDDLFMGFSFLRELAPIIEKIRSEATRCSGGLNDKLFQFTVEDLLASAERAGFAESTIEITGRLGPGSHFVSAEGFRRLQGNPFVPTCGELVGNALEEEEAAVFYQWLGDSISEESGLLRRAGGLLVLNKSADRSRA